MKKINLWVFLLFCAALAAAEGRYALIMGNSAYEVSPLVNPENDARAMAETLESLGFVVTPVYNGTNRQMIAALNQFKSSIRPGDTGLFYYAGHGIQVDGLNYLVPVDAELGSQEDIEFETLQLDRVVRSMENSGAAASIVILDSCRDNPFKGATRSLSRGLSVVNAAQGSLVIYATAPGEVAQDGTGDNGLFTSVLLKYLKEPGIEVNRMLTRIRMEVSDLTGGKQVPYASVSLMDDFYFNTQGINADLQASLQKGKFVLPLLPQGVNVVLDEVPYSDQLEQRGEFLVSASLPSGKHILAFRGEYIPVDTKFEIRIKERETVNLDLSFPEYGKLRLILPEKPLALNLTGPDENPIEPSPELLLPPGTYRLGASYADDPVKNNFTETILIKPLETLQRDLNGLDYSPVYKVSRLEEKRNILTAGRQAQQSERKSDKTKGWSFLAVGALLGAGSAASYYLGDQAYQSYESATFTADATASREDMNLYSSLLIGTLTGSVISLVTGTIFHLSAPNPGNMDEQIRILDEQIRMINQEAN